MKTPDFKELTFSKPGFLSLFISLLLLLLLLMTLIRGSKVQHKRTGKLGSVRCVDITPIGNIRLRYVRISWDNDDRLDQNSYLVRDFKEIKSTVSISTKKKAIKTLQKEARAGSKLLNDETEILRFLNPGISDSEIKKALDANPSKSLLTNPEFLMNPHQDKSIRSTNLQPGQSTVSAKNNDEEEWVDIDSIADHNIEDRELEDADRSKCNINIDAVNYQVRNL
jgi:hypothetical protein